MSAAGFPLERWAARAPRTRWPLVGLLILLLVGLAGGLTGCGPDGTDDKAACEAAWAGRIAPGHTSPCR